VSLPEFCPDCGTVPPKETVRSDDSSEDLSSFDEEELIVLQGALFVVSDDVSEAFGGVPCGDFEFAGKFNVVLLVPCAVLDLSFIPVTAGGFASSLLGNLILILRTS